MFATQCVDFRYILFTPIDNIGNIKGLHHQVGKTMGFEIVGKTLFNF